jgi:hypothetical protein
MARFVLADCQRGTGGIGGNGPGRVDEMSGFEDLGVRKLKPSQPVCACHC